MNYTLSTVAICHGMPFLLTLEPLPLCRFVAVVPATVSVVWCVIPKWQIL